MRGFLIFFTLIGFGLGFQSVLLSHIAFSIPIVVLMVLPKLQEMNDSMVDAARDLGANNFQVVKISFYRFISRNHCRLFHGVHDTLWMILRSLSL